MIALGAFKSRITTVLKLSGEKPKLSLKKSNGYVQIIAASLRTECRSDTTNCKQLRFVKDHLIINGLKLYFLEGPVMSFSGEKFDQLTKLGDMYATGQDVEIDRQKAIKFYTEAHGAGYAFYQLGNTYLYGLGRVPKNKITATMYYVQAEQLGFYLEPADDPVAVSLVDAEYKRFNKSIQTFIKEKQRSKKITDDLQQDTELTDVKNWPRLTQNRSS